MDHAQTNKGLTMLLHTGFMWLRLNCSMILAMHFATMSVGGRIQIVPHAPHPGIDFNLDLFFFHVQLVFFYCDHEDH